MAIYSRTDPHGTCQQLISCSFLIFQVLCDRNSLIVVVRIWGPEEYALLCAACGRPMINEIRYEIASNEVVMLETRFHVFDVIDS